MADSQDSQSAARALRDAVREYLAALSAEAGLSPRTVAAYRHDLERAARFLTARGAQEWDAADADDVAALFADARASGLAPASLSRLLSSLRGLYRWLRAEGRLSGRDPTRFGGRVRLWQRLPGVLTPEEARALLDHPPAEGWKGLRDRALLALLYGGGLRVSEAVGLRLGGLDLRGRPGDPIPGTLRVLGKGAKERLVPFGGLGRVRLEQWLEEGRPRVARDDGDAVLLSRTGRPLDRQRAWRLVRDAALAAGLSTAVHPHTLRHSCATHLLLGGGDLRGVQEFLGHADVATTERYTHVEAEELRALHRLHHPRA